MSTATATTSAPAPKYRATIASRKKPIMRDSIVMLLNRAKTANKFMFTFFGSLKTISILSQNKKYASLLHFEILLAICSDIAKLYTSYFVSLWCATKFLS